MSKEYKFFATTPLNIEDILASELRDFGADNIKQVKAGVHFSGSLETAYRACLWSRTANRILFPIKEFSTESKEQLYDCVKMIKWDNIFSVDDSFAVSARVSKSEITSERFAALVVKDAVVDYFRDLTGKRPDVEKDRPKVQLNLHIFMNQATISLDLSGDSLHRRGYRLEGSSASLKENTAAALLYRSNWKEIASGGGAFVDPMCGGGTLPIEAAFIAGDIAPGLYRSYFG
ncbi:MAG: 23S rRNA (guanine(2445)-N(2))/(guanine(2069)-N(7))-methyltransferase, partial [Proteobacteria bacterium]|nr:23S rRNA (guanine(2445)-N(2))/(guanine(2069)-N(7))-methyltransferase [Pseudomonadota bacterium]